MFYEMMQSITAGQKVTAHGREWVKLHHTHNSADGKTAFVLAIPVDADGWPIAVSLIAIPSASEELRLAAEARRAQAAASPELTAP